MIRWLVTWLFAFATGRACGQFPTNTEHVSISNGIFWLHSTGYIGQPYTLQASSNLTEWIELTNWIGTGPSITVTGTFGTTPSDAFFLRVKSP